MQINEISEQSAHGPGIACTDNLRHKSDNLRQDVTKYGTMKPTEFTPEQIKAMADLIAVSAEFFRKYGEEWPGCAESNASPKAYIRPLTQHASHA